MKLFLERNIIKWDFSRLPPRDFRCFSMWLSKLLSSNKVNEPNSNKIYHTNISINANILMNNPQQAQSQFIRNNIPPNAIPQSQTQPQASMYPKQQHQGVFNQNNNNMKKMPMTDQKMIKKPVENLNDENFWDKMVNLVENPYLNDAFIKETIKQKKTEKRKAEVPLKEAEISVKKVKKEEVVKNLVNLNKNNGNAGFLENFKDVLKNYEEGFKQNLLNNLEKFRLTGYSVLISNI